MTHGDVAGALNVTPSMTRRAMKVLDVLGIGTFDGVEESSHGGRVCLRPEWWPSLEVPGAPMEGRWLLGLPS